MIKRIFAFIILSFFIMFKCLTWIPSAAVTGIPAIDALEYTILQTIGMATANGAEIDFTNSLADIIHDVSEGTFSVEYGLKELLKRYASTAWDQIVFDLNDPNNQENLSFLASGIANASGMSINYLMDISRQYQNKCLDTSLDVVAPFTDKVIAQWNKYRTDYINEYLDRMNKIVGDAPIDAPAEAITFNRYYQVGVPSVPSWANFSTTSAMLNCSYPSNNYVSDFPVSDSWFPVNGYLNITNDNGYWQCSLVGDILNAGTGTGWDYNSAGWNGSWNLYAIGNTPPYNPLERINNSLMVLNNDLVTLLNYLPNFARKVPVYINGIAYATAATSAFGATVPNAVIDTSTDDGKIVSNPIYWVVDSNTGNPIDAQINLDKLANILKGMIDGTREDTTIGFDDLVDAGAIEKTDGTTITDTEVGTKSIADIIADATTDIGDLSITGEIAGVIPPLPILPTFSAGPQGDPTAGFRGMSVLARIINVTNRGLPDDLIAMFYGIVACLIVLGLIKVLHK